MSPVFPLPLTQLEMKALWVHGFATADARVDGMDETLTEAFLSGLQKLQNASHRFFTPAEEQAVGSSQ